MGGRDAVTVDDKYHLGSNTKAMTATLTAILIEDGLLDWDTTVGEVLGRKVRGMHDDYRDVTIEQLLAHVGGTPGDSPPVAWRQAWAEQGKVRPPKQRLNFVKAVLTADPEYAPGSKTVYSNSGYAVAGVMLETLTKDSWEDLMTERLFERLGMTSAGFRAPEGKHPWGHTGDVATQKDNPDAIGPAGTVHASIGDWAKFAQFHLARKPGTLLKKKESFDKLNATLENSGKHGIGGWLVGNNERFGGHFIQMTGSNTHWYALLWILPARNTAVVVATNAAPKNAFKSCDKVVFELLKAFPEKP